ncbi:hypothetical protein Tsubulata_047473 [Turnera subulata]|uniref:DRBM domain-containing protein n=1 Tax=Turnera subulata TaxID=218843 RepID=A0A9Q0JN77_9ROSI|nr:hypothetical protein Tsubulata_047473 [Turnera subulata]
MEPLLSPIVTLDKLKLSPWRELTELCDSYGYFVKKNYKMKGETFQVVLKVQLNDVLLVEDGFDRSVKAAKEKAASLLLKKLEKRGMVYSRGSSKRKENPDLIVSSSLLELANEDLSGAETEKQQKKRKIQSPERVGGIQSPSASPLRSPPAIEAINMRKGGPRTTLNELCKRVHWPSPSFQAIETKSRTPIELIEDGEIRTGFNSFVSEIILNVPGFGVIECTGEARADKKRSFDSAAVAALYELEKHGLLIIGDSN